MCVCVDMNVVMQFSCIFIGKECQNWPLKLSMSLYAVGWPGNNFLVTVNLMFGAPIY
jgi:hypothetical protein